VVSSM